MKLAGEGAGGREAGLEGLWGAMRVAEVLRLALEALSVPTVAGAALRLGARELRGEDTLAEAGVGAGAGGAEELWVAVGVAGGMPTVEGGGVFGALDALQAQVSGLVSVLDLAPQGTRQSGRREIGAIGQERAAAAPVFPMTAEVVLFIAAILQSRLLCQSRRSLDPAGSYRQGGQHQAVEELRARVRGAEARADEERRRLAEAEARLEAEVKRLQSGSSAQAMTPYTHMYAWCLYARLGERSRLFWGRGHVSWLCRKGWETPRASWCWRMTCECACASWRRIFEPWTTRWGQLSTLRGACQCCERRQRRKTR